MKLHIIQALFGDSMIIEYGTTAHPKFILIDGGPATVYRDYLKDEITNIIGNSKELEAVIISHIDTDHIKGILDLVTDLKKQRDQEKEELVNIKELWHNSFSETIDIDGSIVNRLDSLLSLTSQNNINMEHSGIVPLSVREGNKVRTTCADLEIPINTQTNNNFYSLDNTGEPIIFGNLSFTIIGPTQENLLELRNEWDEWLENRVQEMADGKMDLTALSDDSAPNLSSIMFLLKAGSKTILFTGDGRGDHIIEGLKRRKLLKYGRLHVDILKVPHHGSDRNTDRNFFDNITADTYIISANGKHDNPDYATLGWIIEAAKAQKREINILVTNETKSTKKVLKDYEPGEWGYTLSYIPEGQNSTFLDL